MNKLNLHNQFQFRFQFQFQKSVHFIFVSHFIFKLQMYSININDNFIINDISKKNYYKYGEFDETLFISDMKRFFVFTHDPFVFYVRQ
jgi:hypothetical protein